MPPPPPGSGGKYAIFGIALLAAAGGLAYCLTTEEPPATSAVADAPDAATLQPSTSLQDEILEIPEEVPDAWEEIPDGGPMAHQRAEPRGPALGSWDCAGEVDRAAAHAVINEHRPQIQACYERRLKQQQFLQGSVTVQLRVAQGGNVDAVQVSGSLRDREVFSCIRNVANQMRFARVTGGHCAVLSAPFTFTPQQ